MRGLEELAVRFGVEERADLARVGRADSDHPGLLPAVLVHELGLVRELGVHPLDLAAQGREEIAQRLDALDGAERLPTLTVSPTFTSRFTSVMSPSSLTAKEVTPTRKSSPLSFAHS